MIWGKLLFKNKIYCFSISKIKYLLFALLTCCFLSGTMSCYTLKGFSIDPNVQKFYIGPVENFAESVVADLGITFRESFRNKIRTDTRLTYSELEPDIEFVINITRFRDTYQSPQANDEPAFNRLTMAVSVNYIDNKDETKNWEQSFDDFADFGADENLLDVQDNLITTINDKIITEIFNKAFTNW